MSRVLYVELMKLKRTKILWLCVVGAYLPLMINYFGAKQGNFDWAKFYFFNWNMLYLLGPVLFSTFASNLIIREYQEKTINNLFLYPYSRLKFFIGKFLICLFMILATMILSLVGVLIAGQAVISQEISTDMIFQFFIVCIVSSLLQWLLVSISVFASICTKSYIAPVIIGICLTIVGMMAMSTEYAPYFPYSNISIIISKLPALLSGEIINQLDMRNVIISILSISITGFTFIFLSAWSYMKNDIHN
ncbi:TPA: ABC transporter permease [Bacillus thuringiensis]|uniref:ABC transporter permease n=1 Tax=Bacillus sp. CH_70 TaxID=2978215 RepID=UPI0030FBE216|nr:ABC transporter permease [Bacillus thuringiensis]